jgi:hypothetical protein
MTNGHYNRPYHGSDGTHAVPFTTREIHNNPGFSRVINGISHLKKHPGLCCMSRV